jgi:antitoxin (DNA-binding transcriptional repressor) of toxin-antitoxin stability system
MTTVTIQEAQSTLTDLIHRLSSGEEVLITENEQPVARLSTPPLSPTGKPGSWER